MTTSSSLIEIRNARYRELEYIRLLKCLANYLKLPNADMYTGHCFRRTSAIVIADTGADFETLKRLGGWRSSSVAESYIEDLFEKKRKVSKLILGEKVAGSSMNRLLSSCEAEASTSTSVTSILCFRFTYCCCK
jgi:hypothetical protein